MKCEYCGSNHNGIYGSGRFCSTKCARGFSTKAKRNEINAKVSKTLGGKNWKPKETHCLYCGKKLTKKSRKFCNSNCKQEYEYLIFINKWKLGLEKGRRGKYSTSNYIRKYMFLKYKSRCQKCGWNKLNTKSNNIPLELHHKDGNFKNNNELNLELLCPNCHSITSTYKALNKNGKRKR